MKVKCCYNCKFCHITNGSSKFCTTKNVNVEVDDKCMNHIPRDIMTEFEEDGK